MQEGDNKDSIDIQKHGSEGTAMDETVNVGNNHLETDPEGIGNDTGQLEDEAIGDDNTRIRSDSVDSDLVGLEADLELFVTLTDLEARRRILAEDCDLSHLELATIGDSSDEEQEGDDEDNMSSCYSDSADWITLRPDQENMDSSKIAALSSAFSTYISSPKHNKNAGVEGCVSEVEVDPSMGQFLLPLVTEQLPIQDLTPSVEQDRSVMEVLSSEKDGGDEMNALAWRIMGEYVMEKAGTGQHGEIDKQKMIQLISKCMSQENSMMVFQELNKEIQTKDEDMPDEQVEDLFSKLLQDDNLINCLNSLESETVTRMGKFSDTRLVKSILRCMDPDPSSQDEEKDKTPPPFNKTFKFLENSPLRSTLEQYMMMQIASREAEAQQNQRLLQELASPVPSPIAPSPPDSGVVEPPQRIFDCDSVNTTARFLPVDEEEVRGSVEVSGLCPGGCGNVKHCTPYANNGASEKSGEGLHAERSQEAEMGEQDSDKDRTVLAEEDELGRVVDAQWGWWELRSLLCALWRAADVGGLACKGVAVATYPPCHCCRCAHPSLTQVPIDGRSSSPSGSCQCHRDDQQPNQPRERCRSCQAHQGVKQVWGGKVGVKIPPACCCQQRRSNRSYHSCVVRLFFKDPAVSPVDFDIMKSEYETHTLELDSESNKFLKECHQRYLDGEQDIPSGDEDVVALCARCKCKCGRAKFYCPKARDRTIKQNIDNFTRLAPQLLILRVDSLCSTLCAWHGAHLSRVLASGGVMSFLSELWRRAAAMRNGGIALSGILGPSRRRLATVCGRLLAPHQYLSVVYRAWADRAAATRVVHLSMLQLLGRAPPQTVEALHSFSFLLSMMNEAETLRGDVTTFLGNYGQCERDEFLISLRFRLMMAQRKNLVIARFFGLLGDDPCELKANKDCESSVVARQLSECLPTDPVELEEFKSIVQAMLLYHSSGGTTQHIEIKSDRHNSSSSVNSGPYQVRRGAEGSVKCDSSANSDSGRKDEDAERDEKSRIVNMVVNAFNSVHQMYRSIDVCRMGTSSNTKTSECACRPRPVKRKFKSGDTTEEFVNACSDNPQNSAVGLRTKPGCHKTGLKSNRISKQAKGRYIKNIRRASIGHMSEMVKKEATNTTKQVCDSPKASQLGKRGRSVSLYSETRKYLESAIREYEGLCPVNTVHVSGTDNVLRWYSMPDITTTRDSDSDSSINSAMDAFTSLRIDEDIKKLDSCRKHTKELNSNLKGLTSKLKGLTSKLIPELFVPPPSVDPFIDIQLKKDFDIYVKNDAQKSNDDVLDKLRKPIFNNETPEQKYLRMQMYECLEKMELLGLEDQEQQNKSIIGHNGGGEGEEVPSPPLELSPTIDNTNVIANDESQNKRRLLSLNQSLMTGKSSDINSILCPTNDIMVQEKNILKDFIDHEIGNKKDVDLSLDDIKLTEALPFLEATDDATVEKQVKDNLNMKIVLRPKKSDVDPSDVETIRNDPNLKHLNEIIKEHGIESEKLKQLLDPVNLVKTFGTKNLWNITDDLSLLTPETIKQLKEVRQARMKKQVCGKRKNSKKNNCECVVNNIRGISENAHIQAALMEDPSKEEIMIEMLGHRNKKKGFKSIKEFEAKLLTASLQVVMRKVLQVLMPWDYDLELENLKKSDKFGSPYDVKVGNEIDGCNIDDYWESIKAQFNSWRAYTLEQYWNLPEQYRNSVANCDKKGDTADCHKCDDSKSSTDSISQDEQKKKTIVKKAIASKVITLDAAKAKNYLTPVEHALFVERLQAVNKDYVDKLLKQNLSGEDWIFAMNELQNLEHKLMSAVKEMSNNSNSTGSSKVTEEAREAELLAGRGLSKLINQFAKKAKDTKQDSTNKTPKATTGASDATKTDKPKQCTNNSTATTNNPSSTNKCSKPDGATDKEEAKSTSEQGKSDVAGSKCNKDEARRGSKVHSDKIKTVLVSGKARPVVVSQADRKVANKKAPAFRSNSPLFFEIATHGNIDDEMSIDYLCKHCRDCGPECSYYESPSDGSKRRITKEEACEGKCLANHRTAADSENAANEAKDEDKSKKTELPKDEAEFHDMMALRDAQFINNFINEIERQDESKSSPLHATTKPQPVDSATSGSGGKGKAVEEEMEVEGETCKEGHGHQHACANGGQRDGEYCAHHTHGEGANRCSQHSNTARPPANGAAATTNDCNCCYCTVFGHATPALTPNNKSFNETRERLRSILNRKKQRCRPSSSISSQGDSDTACEGKPNGKTEEIPSIIPVLPTVKPDPLPISTPPKQKTPQPICATNQAEPNRTACSQQPQQQQQQAKPPQPPVKTAQMPPIKPPTVTTQQQAAKNGCEAANSQKPNLPLKLKIKQSEGQIAIQDMIKKDVEPPKGNCKETIKNALFAKEVKSATATTNEVKKTTEPPKAQITAKEAAKTVKDSFIEVIKNSTNPANAAKVAVDNKITRPPASIAVRREKSDVMVQKQPDVIPTNVKVVDPEREVEEQNLKNAKKHKITTAVNEFIGAQQQQQQQQQQQLQTEQKARSQSVQGGGHVHTQKPLNIQKTGPQPLQQPTRRQMEQPKPKAIPVRNEIQQNPSSTKTSRDCSIFSTSTFCSDCSVDPRDLDMLMDFIEGPGSVKDKMKKKTKKAKQKAKKVIEKLEAKVSKFEVKVAQLRAESNKLDKLLLATVGKKKKPSKKGKKQKSGESEVEEESVVALRRTAREYREKVAHAMKELEDGRKILNRVAKALLLIGSTEDISQLPEVIAVQQQVSVMTSLEGEMDAPSIAPHHLQELERIATLKHNTQQNQQQQQQQQHQQNNRQPQQQQAQSNNAKAEALDQILTTSLQNQPVAPGKPPSQCMVTIKRVMMPDSGEPSVTITPKGSDKPIYTFQNRGAMQQQQMHEQTPPQDLAATKKKSQMPSWESTLAQINSLSQGKKKKEKSLKDGKPDVESKHQQKETAVESSQVSKANKQQPQKKQQNINEKPSSSVSSSLYPSRSTSTVSELSIPEETTLSKKQRKQLAKKLQQEEEEKERKMEEMRLAAQKAGNKKNNKNVKCIQEELEDDPEKIVLSMRQLKTAVERALEAMDSDVSGQKIKGKGKLKDNAKEFIEKVVSKVEVTKKATTTLTNPDGKRVDKVVDISEVVLGSFSGKMASATAKQQQQQPNQTPQNQKNVQKNVSQKQQNVNQKQQSGNQKQQSQNPQPQQASNDKRRLKEKEVVSQIDATKGNKKNTGKKAQVQNQPVTSVHHRSVPIDTQQFYKGQTASNAGKGQQQNYSHHPNVPAQHQNTQKHQHNNASYTDRINLNSDITIQLADKNDGSMCGNGNNPNMKAGGPVSCSIMEQLRNGVQVPDLKLPPGITLTWVDPNKKQPDPVPKSAIPVVKLSNLPAEYKPTPPVVQPPPLIMVDTKSIPHNRDPKTQINQSTHMANNQQQQDGGSKSKNKKSKKKGKGKPPLNLIQQSETSTHSHPRTEEQPKMVTLRNPMFHPTLPSVSLSSVQSGGKRVSENIRIPDPIPMPPNACQATITPTSNGMFTIRNPLMSMVHQQNMMAMKDNPMPSSNSPVVLMSSTGSVLTTDVNQMKEQNVNAELAGRMADMKIKSNGQQMPKQHSGNVKDDNVKMSNANPDFITQNLSFTPNKDNRGYSLFKSEDDNNVMSSPLNPVIGQVTQENNACPSPIGSKTSRSLPQQQLNSARQLDFNSAGKPQLGNMVGGWQDCPIGAPNRKMDDVNSEGNMDGYPPGFYTPFGQADPDKLFGSLLFPNPSREEHLQQAMWSIASNDDQTLRNPNLYSKMDLLANSGDISIIPSSESKQSINTNGGRNDYRSQATPVGYGAKNSSMWNGPFPPNFPRQEFPQSTQSTQFYPQGSTNAYGQNFQAPINPNYAQIRLSHSSSSSGLMTSSVISSGTNSVYDSVSNSSSNSPADATNPETVDVTNIQQASPESRNYGDFTSFAPQQVGNNFNAFAGVSDNTSTAERMAELLANRDRLNELGWYAMGNQSRTIADTFNQLRLAEEQNFISQQSRLNPDFNTDLNYFNAMQGATANSFSPKGGSGANMEGFRQSDSKLNVDVLQLDDAGDLSSKFGTFGAIGQGKQQPSVTSDEGQNAKNLGAIGSHRSGATANGLRQDEYYSGDIKSIFAPDQTIGDLNELESTDRDIESFKRFNFYFEPPKNKPKILLNLKDIRTKDK